MKFKKIYMVVISAIMIIMGIICILVVRGDISTEKPEKRWAGDSRPYAYVAAFFPETKGAEYSDIIGYRHSLETCIKENSIETLPGARAYNDAYSAYTDAVLSNDDKGSTCEVNICAYGGSYDFFHPMELVDGSFVGEDDIMKDGIVLDENAAWFLFGSPDITGRYVSVGDEKFYVSGVVRATDNGYDMRPWAYIPYEAYEKITESCYITCYEIVYPDIVSGYAHGKLSDAVNQTDDAEMKNDSEAVIVNVTDRFRTANIWKVLLSYGKRSAQTDGIIYPYWENECRKAEDYCAAALLWCIIWGIIATGHIIILCVRLKKELCTGN